MKIYVIRHGQTNVNLEGKINALNDEDLNQTGIFQAKEVGKKLGNIDYDFIIASPLTRTKHTAMLLNTKGKPIIYDDRIIERDAGIYTKQPVKDMDSEDWWNVNPKLDYKTAESVKNVLNRTYNFLEEVKVRYKDKNIILVTHGGISRAISCYFCGIPADGNLECYKQDNCDIKVFNI